MSFGSCHHFKKNHPRLYRKQHLGMEPKRGHSGGSGSIGSTLWKVWGCVGPWGQGCNPLSLTAVLNMLFLSDDVVLMWKQLLNTLWVHQCFFEQPIWVDIGMCEGQGSKPIQGAAGYLSSRDFRFPMKHFPSHSINQCNFFMFESLSISFLSFY